MMKFSVIGPSGYIGKRHIDAIYSNNGEVVSYFDVNECNFFNEKTSFFTQENDFFDSLRDSKPDFCVVCSPNYLHCKHIVLSLKSGIEVISEKPVCIEKNEYKMINNAINASGVNVHSIMQLRLHPVLDKLKSISASTKGQQTAEISFISPREEEYLNSWKTKKEFSGGILFNLGVHYFDLLIEAFGEPIKSDVEFNEPYKAKGTTQFKNLDVNWYFSIDPEDQNDGLNAQRIFRVANKEIEFSKVRNDLHTENYSAILTGSNFFSFDKVKKTMDFMFSINE